MFFDKLFIVSDCVIDTRWTAITFPSPIVCGLHVYIELRSQEGADRFSQRRPQGEGEGQGMA